MPELTEELVKVCKELGIAKVLMQPGSEAEKAFNFWHEEGIEVVHGVRIMIERKSRA